MYHAEDLKGYMSKPWSPHLEHIRLRQYPAQQQVAIQPQPRAQRLPLAARVQRRAVQHLVRAHLRGHHAPS